MLKSMFFVLTSKVSLIISLTVKAVDPFSCQQIFPGVSRYTLMGISLQILSIMIIKYSIIMNLEYLSTFFLCIKTAANLDNCVNFENILLWKPDPHMIFSASADQIKRLGENLFFPPLEKCLTVQVVCKF